MLLQYLWKHRMLGDRLETVDGRRVRVLYAGRLNSDSGPDFSGARLQIEDEEWVGNVEIHVKASDWHRHGHDHDLAYDNVIFHLVGVSDVDITDSHGRIIPQGVATFPESFISLYSRLARKIGEYKCDGALDILSSLQVSDWLSTLSIERMQAKGQRIKESLAAMDRDWEWVCFATLARALGFGLNSEPLEMTARITPLRILHKHSDDIMQLEALLMGQAGLLDSSLHMFDERYQLLCREYRFLAMKYGLRPARREMWKYSKTRPQNFPARRLAMLAGAVRGGFSLLSRLCDPALDSQKAMQLFDWEMDPYWENHYDFDVAAAKLPLTLTQGNRRLLLINFVAPMLYTYGAMHGDLEMTERAMRFWDSGQAENNRYTRHWEKSGIVCRNASDSQALIQLSKEYCECGRCLECRFGHLLLRKAAVST